MRVGNQHPMLAAAQTLAESLTQSHSLTVSDLARLSD